MKKNSFFLTFSISFIALSLTGCSFLRRSLESSLDSYSNHSTGTFDVNKTTVDGKTIIQQTYKDYSNNSVYPIDYCPTKGNINLLVIPVWLSDSSDYIQTAKKGNIYQSLQKAYFGTNEQTGWRSVKTYYEELSGGALRISGKVTNWYETSYSSSQVGINSGYTEELVKSATDWYFANNPTDARTNYDSDNNGFLDAVMLIYGAPDYAALNNKSLENLWAYCYWLQEPNENTYPVPNAYFWASYDFMFSKGSSFKPTPAGTTYGSGDTSHCEIDAHTYIHEMGHIFGLEDYYDYSNQKYFPAGGFSMQDYNVGSHDPYSVMALGWANPYIVSDNSEITIGTFQKTRELIVLTNGWNEFNSPFDEYIVFELYSPTGLNEFDCRYAYSNTIKGPSKVGVRLWHVDGRLTCADSYTTITKNGKQYNVPVYRDYLLTSDTKDKRATFGITHAFSNTYYDEDYGSVLGSKYYELNILQLLKNNRFASYSSPERTIVDSDLFTSGSYDLFSYYTQFYNGLKYKMNNGTTLGWSFRINISGSGNDATAKIEIVKTNTPQ